MKFSIFIILWAILGLKNNLLATNVITGCDILFYENDTLFVDKLFQEKIIKEIQKQKNFKINENPKGGNWYTAFWLIKNDSLFLLKITNCRQNLCNKLGENDTLDLKRAFKRKYKNGMVKMENVENLILAHNRFAIRNPWNWFPVYLEDITFRFENSKLKRVEKKSNYVNEKDKLNRYTWYQANNVIYENLRKNLFWTNNDSIVQDWTCSIEVVISSVGQISKLEFQKHGITEIYEDNVEKFIEIYNFNNIDTNKVKDLFLNFKKWDEIIGLGDEKFRYNFEFNPIEKIFYDKNFELDNKTMFRLEQNLPYYLRDIYNDY